MSQSVSSGHWMSSVHPVSLGPPELVGAGGGTGEGWDVVVGCGIGVVGTGGGGGTVVVGLGLGVGTPSPWAHWPLALQLRPFGHPAVFRQPETHCIPSQM
jgi:hypothetical protein